MTARRARGTRRRRQRLATSSQQLRRSEATQRACLDALEQGVVLSTLDGEILVMNDAAQRILGCTAAELGTRYADGGWQTFREDGSVLPPDERPLVRTMLTGEAVRDAIMGLRDEHGRLVLLRVATQPVRNDAGSMTGVVTAFTDITQFRQAADSLRETQAQFAALIEQSSDIICLLEASGRIRYASPAAERILGYDLADDAEPLFLALIHPDDVPATTEAYDELLLHPGVSQSVQIRLMGREGEWLHMEVLATNRLDDPDVRGIVANVRDITERAQEAARLTWQAYHDTLTGLANRALLHDRLDHALQRARRARELTGLLFIDLDGFKQVNDELGHEAGDRLLVEVADRLTEVVRTGDTVARLGGDEFVILAETLTVRAEASVIADRVLAALSLPFHINGVDVTVSASVGVAFDEVHNPDLLLRDADAALYQAKRGGGGRYVVYGPQLGSPMPVSITR